MTMPVIRLDTTELDRVAAKLNVSRKAVCRRLAFEIQGKAQQLAPVDTSALRNSIYTATDQSDNFNAAKLAATQANPDVTCEQAPTPAGDVVAVVSASVEYAEYVEFGTSKMAAQPYFTPAIELTANKMNEGETWKELTE